ncbi:MAG TPA: SsrA-binding protein SmpB [Candidatus Saccharimonadales bacterium]|jgi:SsrA-binding protein|nr:SsrA-binding protein SmpB [Candidatus Saccharimonadales bacterium]
MAKKQSNTRKKIVNRRAKFDYELGDSLVVGLQLTGAETRALRLGQGHLRGAYLTIKDNELWLVNSTIAGGVGIHIETSDQTRDRKVLAKRKEIDSLIESKKAGRTIVPLEISPTGRYIKLRIAIGKGKKKYDKRNIIKAREEDRRMQAAVKNVLS